MFIDSAVIFCQAGPGGDGCNSFDRGKGVMYKRATGGDGGDGGSIILRATGQVHTLLDVQMKKTFHAHAGKHGGGNNMSGARGGDETVLVPIGTVVSDEDTGHLLKDLAAEGESVIVCRGGAAGKGNHRKADATKGLPGEERNVRLELKLLADVGLVGFPNAGKSTLISHISNAKSKIAAYPFTTKEPILGVVKSGYGDSFVVADIPGLIEGAHAGRGLGQQFLKHIERTRIFLHLVDMAGVDGRNPVDDYHTINSELSSYSPMFKDKPRIVAANKMDIPEAQENLVKFKRDVPVEVFEISGATGQGLNELVKYLFRKLSETPK